jgi:hypothetical protein
VHIVTASPMNSLITWLWRVIRGADDHSQKASSRSYPLLWDLRTNGTALATPGKGSSRRENDRCRLETGNSGGFVKGRGVKLPKKLWQ